MTTNNDAVPFERIHGALASVEFFRGIYASSAPSSEHARAVVDGLRASAASVSQSNPHAAALYEHVATGIELYIGLKPLSDETR
jgi:hypothetical protein